MGQTFKHTIIVSMPRFITITMGGLIVFFVCFLVLHDKQGFFLFFLNKKEKKSHQFDIWEKWIL